MAVMELGEWKVAVEPAAVVVVAVAVVVVEVPHHFRVGVFCDPAQK